MIVYVSDLYNLIPASFPEKKTNLIGSQHSQPVAGFEFPEVTTKPSIRSIYLEKEGTVRTCWGNIPSCTVVPSIFLCNSCNRPEKLFANKHVIHLFGLTHHTHPSFHGQSGLREPSCFFYVVSSAKTLSDLRRLQMQHAPEHHEDQKYGENDPKHLGRWKALVQ